MRSHVYCALALAAVLCVSASASAALTPDQEALAERLIRDFGAIEFSVRQEAVDELVKLGPDVLPLVERTRARTTDAEVKLRCEMVIKALSRKPAKPVVNDRIDEKILKVLGPMAYGRARAGWYRSRDGMKRIFCVQKDGKTRLVYNDWESGPYDEIDMLGKSYDWEGSSFVARRDGKAIVVINQVEEPPVSSVVTLLLSRDGHRSVYSCRDQGRGWVVLDGKRFGPYEQPPTLPGFSKDGRHVAWVVDEGDKEFVVVDGREGARHDHVCNFVLTQPGDKDYDACTDRFFVWDSRRVRLVQCSLPPAGSDPKAPLVERELRVVGDFPVDMRRGLMHHATPNGHHLIVRSEDGRTAYCDGKTVGTYDSVDYIHMSADGAGYALLVRRDGKSRVVWNGKEGGAYDRVAALYMLSKEDLAYVGLRDGKLYCVFGAEEKDLPGYRKLVQRAISDDGRHHAYAAVDGEQTLVIRDGRVVARHEDVRAMAFDPSGERLAYIAVQSKRQAIVCEGKRGPLFELITQGPTFSKDGKHLWYAVKENGKHFVVVDGITGPIHDGGIEMREDFDGKDVFRFVYVDNQDYETLVEAPWPKGADWSNGLEELE